MQDLRTLLLVGVLVAPDEKGVLLLDKFDLVRGEAREGHGDTVVVFAGPLDVVGWPVRRGFGTGRLVQHVEQPVEADRRAVKGGEIVGSHDHILLRATWKRERRIPSGTLRPRRGRRRGKGRTRPAPGVQCWRWLTLSPGRVFPPRKREGRAAAAVRVMCECGCSAGRAGCYRSPFSPRASRWRYM